MQSQSSNRIPTRLLRALRSSLTTLEIALLKVPPPSKSNGSIHINSSTKSNETEFKLETKKVRVTYGSNKSIKRSETPPSNPKFTPKDLKSYFTEVGLSTEIISKAIAAITAYKNVLESIYGIKRVVQERRIQSLSEICSRSLGNRIENNVAACLVEEEAKGGDVPESHVLVEEWYESSPNFCWNWVLGNHATDIVIQKLAIPNPVAAVILESAFDLSLEFGVNEASQFIPAIVTPQLAASYNEIYNFATKCLQFGLSDTFLHCLQRSARGIQLNITRNNLDKSPEGLNFLIELLLVDMELGNDALAFIDLEVQNGLGVVGEGMTEEEGKAQQILVAEGIALNLQHKMALLFNRSELDFIIPEKLTRIIESFPFTFPALAPIIGVFWVEGKYSNIAELCMLGLSQGSAAEVAKIIFSTLASLPSRLHNTISLSNIAVELHQTEQHHLESALLNWLLEVYDRLVDVKSKNSPILPIPRLEIEDRLQKSQGECIRVDAGERLKRIKIGKKTDRKEGVSYRFEEMCSSYVIATPARPTPFIKKTLSRADILNSPLYNLDCPSSENFRIKPLKYLPVLDKVIKGRSFGLKSLPKLIFSKSTKGSTSILPKSKLTVSTELVVKESIPEKQIKNGASLPTSSGSKLKPVSAEIPTRSSVTTERVEKSTKVAIAPIAKKRSKSSLNSEVDELDLLSHKPSTIKGKKMRKQREESESDDELML